MKILFVTNLCEKVNGFHNISEIVNMDCSSVGLNYPLNLLKELSKYASIDVYSPPFDHFVSTESLTSPSKLVMFTPQKIAIPKKTDASIFNKDYDIVLIYAESMFSYLTNFDKIKPKKVMWFLSAPQQVLLPEYASLSADLVIKVVDKAGITEFSDAFRRLGLKTKWLPFSIDEKRFKKLPLAKLVDVCLLGNMNPITYPLRIKALELLRNRGVRMFLTPMYGENYVNAINQSRIFFTCSGIFKFPVMKYFEAPACGTLLMADEPMDADDLGFIADKNYARVDEQTLVERYDYYTTHVKEAEEVAQAGEKLVRERHTDTIRARELYEMLKRT